MITEKERISLPPGYDGLNSSIALRNPQEEMALPIHAKRSRLTRSDRFSYYTTERLQLNTVVLGNVIRRFQQTFPCWDESIAVGLLSTETKQAYAALLSERRAWLKW